jgi:hypothetical protein
MNKELTSKELFEALTKREILAAMAMIGLCSTMPPD